MLSRVPPLSPVIVVACLLWPALSVAHPTGPRTFCEVYADAPSCSGAVPSCMQCHSAPPFLNAYGEGVQLALYSDPSFTDPALYDEHLPAALAAVEGEDSDGDGLTNLEEILLGTLPGDASSHYAERPAPDEGENPHFSVGEYDGRFAFRRAKMLYCGEPPLFDELEDFAAADDPQERLLDELRRCLESEYWREEGLDRLADKRIRPLRAVGFDGLIPLADYAWDYRLFRHVLTGDRDARDLLLADYHVNEAGDVVEGTIDAPGGSPLGTGGQPLVPERRAGMITTQWFLMIHTMFSALPRTTAAQAYRAYLGADIARSEGILPVEGEPRDVDYKRVDHPTCAVCHSTIDPLSYAFASYQGIGQLGNPFRFEHTGTYDPTRTPWGGDSVLLGQPVEDLVEWAEVAADSEMFQRNLASMFWQHALGRPPAPDEQEAFRAIWQALPADGYSANKLIERIVLTDAFGVP